jgi:Domain of unknown function (DUF1707)
MTKRRNAPDSRADVEPGVISLEDKHTAERLLRAAYAAGELDEAELKRRLGRVYGAVTPRDLWKASGGRVGSRRRSDWTEIRRAARLQIAIVVFAILAMLLVLYGTVVYQQGGDTVHRSVFPWEWGKD